LFSALLQALTQAAGLQPGSDTGSSGSAATAPQAGSGSDPTSGSTLAQDLHAFLHDLFGALRQASQQGSGTPASSATSTTSPAAAATTPATVATTPATVATTPVTPAAAGGSAAAVAAQYGQQGIISALQALLADLTNSQLLGTSPGTSSSSLSASTLSTLNSAFTKLISDLQPTSTSGQSGTTALQSFLTNLLQDLQNSSTGTPATLGGTINTTA
jgi:hypothetical protein